jgi:hypothetical protein
VQSNSAFLFQGINAGRSSRIQPNIFLIGNPPTSIGMNYANTPELLSQDQAISFFSNLRFLPAHDPLEPALTQQDQFSRYKILMDNFNQALPKLKNLSKSQKQFLLEPVKNFLAPVDQFITDLEQAKLDKQGQRYIDFQRHLRLVNDLQKLNLKGLIEPLFSKALSKAIDLRECFSLVSALDNKAENLSILNYPEAVLSFNKQLLEAVIRKSPDINRDTMPLIQDYLRKTVSIAGDTLPIQLRDNLKNDFYPNLLTSTLLDIPTKANILEGINKFTENISPENRWQNLQQVFSSSFLQKDESPFMVRQSINSMSKLIAAQKVPYGEELLRRFLIKQLPNLNHREVFKAVLEYIKPNSWEMELIRPIIQEKLLNGQFFSPDSTRTLTETLTSLGLTFESLVALKLDLKNESKFNSLLNRIDQELEILSEIPRENSRFLVLELRDLLESSIKGKAHPEEGLKNSYDENTSKLLLKLFKKFDEFGGEFKLNDNVMLNYLTATIKSRSSPLGVFTVLKSIDELNEMTNILDIHGNAELLSEIIEAKLKTHMEINTDFHKEMRQKINDENYQWRSPFLALVDKYNPSLVKLISRQQSKSL